MAWFSLFLSFKNLYITVLHCGHLCCDCWFVKLATFLSLLLIKNCSAIKLFTSTTNNIITFKIISIKSQSVNIIRLYFGFSFLSTSAVHQIVQENLAIFYLYLLKNIMQFIFPGHIVTANWFKTFSNFSANFCNFIAIIAFFLVIVYMVLLLSL